MEKTIEEENAFYSPEKEEDRDERNETQGNEEEMRQLGLLRAIVEKQDPTCKETCDLTLRRFLRARDHNVEKAAAMFMKYVTWRQHFVPTGSVPRSEVENKIADNIVHIQGKDKSGCPVAVVFGARHFPRKDGVEEFKRFVVFFLDEMSSRVPEGEDKFTIIGDLKGYGYGNIDVRGYLAGLSILQDNYPERIRHILLVNVPYIFMKVWNIVYPFIDKNTRKKFVFVENKRMHDTLRESIDESQLPEIYGGRLQLLPIQDA